MRGDLHALIWDRSGGRLRAPGNPPYFSEHEQLGWFKDIAAGLAHMHRNHIIHCDLKPGNILFEMARALISDLGLCQRVSLDRPTSVAFCGTNGYLAPEVEVNMNMIIRMCFLVLHSLTSIAK